MPSVRAVFLGLAFVVLALIQLSVASPVPTVVVVEDCESSRRPGRPTSVLPIRSTSVRPIKSTPVPPTKSGKTTSVAPTQPVQTTSVLPTNPVTSSNPVATTTSLPSDPVASSDPATSSSDPAATTPTLPLSGDPTELPAAPPANQTLQFVALGRGIQNYTCANASSVPVALGAIATLFDGTALATANEDSFNSLPPIAVNSPLTDLPSPISSLAVLGNHFFAADGTPVFNLSAANKILFCKKTGDIPAPSSASAGPAGTGAVDWLQLVAKPGYASVGLQTVYRVVTAGGKAPATCSSSGVISVQYAAEYWFYD